ncbi:MAG: gamma-glutamyltransferase [Rhodospirillales bacterium]|nr:MAG: gamma-glutamyltransferase [Rhodospirillales bacterium]
MLLSVLLVGVLFAGSAAADVPSEVAPLQPEATTAITERASVTAQKFMVASAHSAATEAGYAVLAAGGSAADAFVAVQVMLNLVEPQSSGLGGGGFLLYWHAALGELTSFDARERAPLSADERYWLGADGTPMGFWEAAVGGRSVGVPGTPLLLETVHARFGRLPWAQLIAPAIATAEEGFPVSQRLAAAIAEARDLDRFAETRAYFFEPDGSPRHAGTILRNPAFARSLRLFAAHGAAPFYTGAIARDMVAAVRTDTNPGILTLEDLATYRVIERPPVCIAYRGHDVCGMGPPSSGGLTVAQILGMLETFDLPNLGPGLEARHLFLEASRLAFADRNLFMADSDFIDMPEGLLNREYLATRAGLIGPDAAMGIAPPGTPPWNEAEPRAPDQPRPGRGTTHLVIVDSYGDVVSATSSIETGFGSRLMTGGFLLNNQLTDFAREPAVDGVPVANRVEGGKRPRSSMAPTVVLRDGAPVLLTGSPGGANIIPYTAASIIAILDWEMDPQSAIDRPHVVNRNGPTLIEEGPEAAAIAADLEALGHDVAIRDLNSGLHVIRIGPYGLTGAADKRREGMALGD